MKAWIGLMVGFLTIWQAVSAQELHFSQYFNAPMLVNPANTGFQPDADYRVGVNYRNQWASVMSNPYKTFSAWGDVQLFSQVLEAGWVGLGGMLLRDQAGTGSLTSTKAYGSIAYHQVLGYNSLISLGFNIGMVEKRIDFTKLTFDNQWNGQFFDNVNIPSNEPFTRDKVSYFDLQAGVNYAVFPTDDIYLNAGISVMHINQPKESFFGNDGLGARLPMRYNLFVNSTIKLNDRWIVNPNLYYSQMTGVSEWVGGLNANYNLSGDGSSQLIGGLYYRSQDAFIPMVGYQWNDFKLIVNYDVTVSSLSKYNAARGAYELSLTKVGIFDPSRPVKCPAVKF